MTTSAKIILDSLSPHSGIRLLTMQLQYPRFIHAEFMTHRMFSRNASSSRAIPVAKMIKMVREDPAMPIHWGANQPGMQADEQIHPDLQTLARLQWLDAAKNAATQAEKMNSLGLHKQVVNRILEPFQHMHVIVTATDWDNFFNLRDHDAAEPNIRYLAQCMKLAMEISKPVVREAHMPYISDEELAAQADCKDPFELPMISAARCARVSYLTHDGESPDRLKDLALAAMLETSRHASPFEHVAISRELDHREEEGYSALRYANFYGWESLRHQMGI